MTSTPPKQKLYYGWVIAITLAFTETISWGIVYYAFTVFITPMERELGWSLGQLTGAFSLGLLVMGAMAYPMGVLIDRYGARWLMTLGSIAASVLMLGWSQVTDIGSFYLLWIGLGICGSAILYEPAFAVMATWFHRNRGRALALITFAAGLASTIFIPLSDFLMNAVGWRDAIVILAIFLAVTTIPLHAFVLRRHPEDMGLRVDGSAADADLPPLPRSLSLSDALHSRFFWMMTLAFGLCFLAASAIRVHFIPFLINAGIDASTAALASGSIGIMQVAGRLVFAPLEMRFSTRMMVMGVFGLQILGMTVLLLSLTPLAIGIFIVLFGAAYGATTLARAAFIADRYGSLSYARISSIMAIFMTIAGTAAPVGAGLIFDATGSYSPVLWGIVILSVMSMVIAGFARPEKIKRVETLA